MIFIGNGVPLFIKGNDVSIFCGYIWSNGYNDGYHIPYYLHNYTLVNEDRPWEVYQFSVDSLIFQAILTWQGRHVTGGYQHHHDIPYCSMAIFGMDTMMDTYGYHIPIHSISFRNCQEWNTIPLRFCWSSAQLTMASPRGSLSRACWTVASIAMWRSMGSLAGDFAGAMDTTH